jgi:hypothetical protein
MSAIADFRLIESAKLDQLANAAVINIEKGFFSKKVIDNYWNFLDANSKKVTGFGGSGYIFGNLFIYLQEKKGINLLEGKYDQLANELSLKRENSSIILTHSQKQNHLGDLVSDNFNLQEMIEFNKEFSEDEDPDLAKYQMEGIKALAESLRQIPSEEYVVLLSVS